MFNMLNHARVSMPAFDPDCEGDALDRFAPVSITLGEWHEMGFYAPYAEDEEGNMEISDEWRWDYIDEAQYKRVCDKFLNEFYYSEIGLFPPFRWRMTYIQAFNVAMAKYKPVYERIANGINPLQESDEYRKSRDIFSDFPATMLSGNSDYASTGSDREEETVREGNFADSINAYLETFRDVDIMLVEEVGRKLFSSLMTATVEMW